MSKSDICPGTDCCENTVIGSSQSEDVLLKKEPNTYDTYNPSNSMPTESGERPFGNTHECSGQQNSHIHEQPRCLFGTGTHYAVCIKYEPNSCEERRSYETSGTRVNPNKSYVQTKDYQYILNSKYSSHCYVYCSHDSDAKKNQSLIMKCEPNKSEIQESHIQENTYTSRYSEPYYANCDNIVPNYHDHDHTYSLYTVHKVNHTVDKPYKCDVCTYSTTRSSDLVVHKRKHTGEKPYKCDICSYSTFRPGYIYKHKRKHTRDKLYKCDVCSYSTIWSGNLALHKRKHTGDNLYSCDVCSFSSVWPYALVRHKRRHTGEKPYKCDMCSYMSGRSGDLVVHKRKHTGEKPYKCDVCSYGTTSSNTLVIHKRKHTGDKPYKCDVCKYSTMWPCALSIHKKRLHMD